MIKKQQGYTLIELLIVMALSAILLSFAIPRFMNFNKRAEVTSNANLIVDSLRSTQRLAEGGVQSSAVKLNSYRVELGALLGATIGHYRGFRMLRVDETDTVVLPVLEEQILACDMCINSSWDKIDFEVPTGVADISTSSRSLTVCSPEQGYYNITINQAGRVDKSDFNSGSGLCVCESTCGDPTY